VEVKEYHFRARNKVRDRRGQRAEVIRKLYIVFQDQHGTEVPFKGETPHGQVTEGATDRTRYRCRRHLAAALDSL
jgi:hypothetical protein